MSRQKKEWDLSTKVRRGIQTEEYALMTDEEKRVKTNQKNWITLFRRNWHIYIEYVLGVPLKPFQRVMFWLAGISDVFFGLASRGIS